MGSCCIATPAAAAAASIAFKECGRVEGFRGISERLGRRIGDCRRIEGLLQRPGRVCARKDDSDSAEKPLVERRKDGRFFMDISDFDEDEDDVPVVKSSKDSVKSSVKRKAETFAKKKSKAKDSKSSRSPSLKNAAGNNESGPGKLRKRSELDLELPDDDEDVVAEEISVKKPISRDFLLKKDGTKPRSSSGSSRNESFSETRGRTGMADRRRERTYEEGEADPRSARRNKKDPPGREQIYLPYVMKQNPHVAILGGGMSGLICALILEERGVRSTVFDTGKHGLGGRMGTRDIVQHEGKRLTFDHAAQYFTVKDAKFQQLVDQWLSEGVVKEWDGVVGMLREGQFTELPQSVKYVATHGMRSLADHLVSKARLINIQRPCWISSIEAVGGSWNLTENGLDQGQFDAVVIAHNGKCANRLLGPSGAPLVARQMKSLELSSVWALLAAFDEPLPKPSRMTDGRIPDAAFVEGVSSLSWMANNSKKLGLGSSQPHCWTFFSTAAYGKKHKVPQESIPSVKAERVKREVLQGVEIALGMPEGTLPVPLYSRVQLWGAALPTNTPRVSCIFDSHSRVGICGDWLLGASLESAALSGMALAHHIADFCERARDGYFEENRQEVEKFCIGLTTPLRELASHDIGEFPGSTTPEQQQITGRALKWRALVTS